MDQKVTPSLEFKTGRLKLNRKGSLLSGLVLGCAAVTAPVMAAETADNTPADAADAWTFNFYFENDLFTNTDQQYTNGVRLSFVSPDIDSFVDDDTLPQWQRDINRYLTYFDPTTEGFGQAPSRRFIFTVGQEMYTPADRERRTADPNDRPYAGWLYAGFGYHTATARKMNSLEVNLGMVGPASLAHQSQDFIHDLRGFKKFKGWDNQLHNELGVQLLFEQKQKLMYEVLNKRWQHDFITHTGGSFGNVKTYLNAGAEYRIGWNLPHDFGTSALRDPRFSSQNYWGVHAFVSLDGRWVLRDIFLDGNTFQDSPSVDKKDFVADAAYGVAATYEKWKMSISHVYRTQEFDEQDGGHNFGSIAVSYSF